MSTKRKRTPAKKTPAKRGKRKNDNELDSDLSDESDLENATQPDEVLIAGHGDALDELTQLPQELLKTLIKPAGQLFIFGLVAWDTVNVKLSKEAQRKMKIPPNLYEPHRFTNERVYTFGSVLQNYIPCGHLNYN